MPDMEMKISKEDPTAICTRILQEVCAHKYLNLRWKDAKSYKSYIHDGWHMYKVSDYVSTKHFNWNQDHDYCEQRYDCYSIIENGECFKFEEVKEFAETLALKYSNEFGVVVEIEIDGVKDCVSVHVDVRKR